jgi:hypothetical protein
MPSPARRGNGKNADEKISRGERTGERETGHQNQSPKPGLLYSGAFSGDRTAAGGGGVGDPAGGGDAGWDKDASSLRPRAAHGELAGVVGSSGSAGAAELWGWPAGAYRARASGREQ